METGRAVAGLVGWLLLVAAVAALAAIASVDAASYYSQLTQPPWAPPPWLFGPVWTVLYALMGFAAWLVWWKNGWRGARVALGAFLIQLAFNSLWSWLFFAWHRIAWAFFDIMILWVLIVVTVRAFARVSPSRTSALAAGLMVPYLLWVTFAAALNYAIWQLNPVRPG